MPGTKDHDVEIAPRVERHLDVLLRAFPVPEDEKKAGLAIITDGNPCGRGWLQRIGPADLEVSEEHFSFDREGNKVFIVDNRRPNGTWINGVRLASGGRALLEESTVLRVGGTILVYRRERAGSLDAAKPLGKLVSPFGLHALRGEIKSLVKVQLNPNNILIEGETGTGKELLAGAIAAQLEKTTFGAINMALLSETLAESELFGHERGAFTSAVNARTGLFRDLEGGAVFLDEIGELAGAVQAKLLRFLQEREAQPIGGKLRKIDLLVIAATNRALTDEVKASRFRQDVLARFTSARLSLVPLRDRIEDIPAIVMAILRKHNMNVSRVEPEAMEALMLLRDAENARAIERVIATALRHVQGSRVDADNPSPIPLPGWAVTRALAQLRTIEEPTDDQLTEMLLTMSHREIEARLQRGHGYVQRRLVKIRSKP